MGSEQRLLRRGKGICRGAKKKGSPRGGKSGEVESSTKLWIATIIVPPTLILHLILLLSLLCPGGHTWYVQYCMSYTSLQYAPFIHQYGEGRSRMQLRRTGLSSFCA
jgi:hypothetical protein